MNKMEPILRPLPPELLTRFAKIVGERNALTDPNDIAPYLIEDRDLYPGRSPLVLRPGSTAEVSAIAKLANETKTAIVPQGGNTGLVGGQTAMNGEVVVSLRRLDKIREVDEKSNTMTCEAGVVLAVAQQKAAEVDRLFPLSLGAEGSCTIGGNLSTNAGGTAALAYGVARDLALGPRGRTARRPRAERAVETQEGQHRLRPARSFHRRRRHARHHHGGGAKTVSEAARSRDGIRWLEVAGRRARAARHRAGRSLGLRHQLRDDAARWRSSSACVTSRAAAIP